jgi:hypothetical protein
MNRISSFITAITLLLAISLKAQVDPIEGSTTGFAGYIYRLYSPESASPENRLPLILFLHGSFERGTDNKTHVGSLINPSHIQPLIDSCMGSEYPAFLLAPQSYQFWDPIVLRQLVETLVASLPVDPNRIYITGISVGGRGTWDAASKGLDIFAAGVPFSARAKYEATTLLGSSGIPLWAFHGDNDPIVPLWETISMINDIKEAGGNPRFTKLPGFAHNDWSPIYADETGFTDIWEGGPEEDLSNSLYDWMFSKTLPETPYHYPPLQDEETLLFDFGWNHRQPNGTTWNNISVDPIDPKQVLTALLNSDGDPRQVGLAINDGFAGMDDEGTSTGELYPTQVTTDYWWTGSDQGHEAALSHPASIVLSQLPTDQTFRLRFFAAKNGTDGSLDRMTQFTANGQSVDLEASDNGGDFVTLPRMVADNEGNLEITVAPSPNGTGRYAYLNALELMVEPWPLNFAYWGELTGIDPEKPNEDQNANGIPELMDFLYGNEAEGPQRTASFVLEGNSLLVSFPIRREETASGKFYLEKSTSLKDSWDVLGFYDFSSEIATNLEFTGTESDMWLHAEEIAIEVGTFYRLRGEIP